MSEIGSEFCWSARSTSDLRIDVIRNTVIIRVNIGTNIAYRELMDEREFPIKGADIALMIFAIVGGWLLLFQSGLF